jgi:hypothetical protein
MNCIFIVLGTDIERWTLFRHRAEPILARHVRHVFHELNNALPRATFP